jgi:tRNA G18 (ribose-2'-O)-methylase SpoU
MQTEQFEIRECVNVNCKLRFSAETRDERRYFCPYCHNRTDVVEVFSRHSVLREAGGISPKIVAVLDNIRSTWNVGSMFRSSDGCGIDHIFLCGITPLPSHPGTKKTALGAENSVSWSHHKNGLELVNSLKMQGFQIWALEGGEHAESLFSSRVRDCRAVPIALVVGNELTGVDPGIIRVSDRSVYLPMLGVKNSLNVAVAFGVALYVIRFMDEEKGRGG